MADAAMVAQVRRFNRAVTARAGALNQRFLGRDLSLGEARVLWEVGERGLDIRALRARLQLDSGYLSRLLRSLEAAGLVELSPSPADRRVRRARLTRKGQRERALLDSRSDDVAEAILGPLDDAKRRRLVDAMREVERLLVSAEVQINAVDPASEVARYCIDAYFAELSARSGVELAPATRTAAQPHELVPPAGRLLVAFLHGEPVGCGAVKHHLGAPTEIKRMWVDASARGLGLGRRLLVELEDLARASGARATRLETNKTLVEAIAMYRSAGYVEVPAFNDEPFANHWFEKRLA
jgi:DNA-binding MarR family transcriptional regulator/GNAT superfamily N-acetyltransferase